MMIARIRPPFMICLLSHIQASFAGLDASAVMAHRLAKVAFVVKLVANATLTSAHVVLSKLDEPKSITKS
jgi:hypothetical protein